MTTEAQTEHLDDDAELAAMEAQLKDAEFDPDYDEIRGEEPEPEPEPETTPTEVEETPSDETSDEGAEPETPETKAGPAAEVKPNTLLATTDDANTDNGEAQEPAAENNDNPNWREARGIMKDQQARIKELEEKLAAQSQPQPTETSTETSRLPVDPSTNQAMSPARVFDIAARAANGDFEGQNNALILQEARAAIAQMTPAEMAQVNDALRQGQFGEYDSDVQSMVSTAYAESLHRDIENNRTQTVQQSEQETAQRERTERLNASFQRVGEQHPELGDPNSDLAKAVKAVSAELVGVFGPNTGELTQPGPYAQYVGIDNWPEVLTPVLIAEAQRRMSPSASELEAETLRKEVDARTAPLASGNGGKSSKTGGDPELAQMEKHLSTQFV